MRHCNFHFRQAMKAMRGVQMAIVPWLIFTRQSISAYAFARRFPHRRPMSYVIRRSAGIAGRDKHGDDVGFGR